MAGSNNDINMLHRFSVLEALITQDFLVGGIFE
jgi:hypothetical protein